MDYNIEYWDKNPTYHMEDAPKKAEEILSLINKNYNSIIDIGCGVGYLTEMLNAALLPKRMKGIDISEDAIKIAKQNSKNGVSYQVDDIRNSKIRDRYELGIVADLIEHLEDDKKFVSDSFRHCETLIIRMPCEKNLYNDLLYHLGVSNEYNSFKERYGHLHHYNIKKLIYLFNSCGVRVIDYKIFYLSKRTKLLNNIAVILSKIIGLFSKRVAIDLFGGFVVFKLEKSYE